MHYRFVWLLRKASQGHLRFEAIPTRMVCSAYLISRSNIRISQMQRKPDLVETDCSGAFKVYKGIYGLVY